MEISDDQTHAVSGTVTSTYYNIIVQIICKLVTFVLNGLILRYISPELLGVVNVRLLLIYTTILFLCREGVRRACAGNVDKKNVQQVVNLIWSSVAVSVLVSFILGILWTFAMEAPQSPYYGIGVAAYAVSSVIEMAAEPVSLIAQELLYLRIRIFAKFSGIMLQSAVNAALIILRPELGIMIFAITQILSTLINGVVLYGYFTKNLGSLPSNSPVRSMTDFLPNFRIRPFLPEGLSSLTVSFTFQSLLKQILTEGERFIMSALQMLTFAEQGVYDLVNNLGSLVARLLFQQVEENAYVLFSKVIRRKGTASTEVDEKEESFGAKMLEVYLKVITSLSLIIVTFGYCYSDVILYIYGGKEISSGVTPDLLKAYWVYVMFMALNGVSEAFAFTAMEKGEVDRYNRFLIVFSSAFLFASWVFVRSFGAVGLIYANILSMSLRIAHSINYIMKYYQSTKFRPLQALFPGRNFISSVFISFCTLRYLRLLFNLHSFSGDVAFLFFGCVFGCGVLVVFWITEKETLMFLWRLLREKKSS